MLRVPSEVLRARSAAWFPFAEHLIRGLYVTARSRTVLRVGLPTHAAE